MHRFDLSRYGIHHDTVLRNFSPAALYEEALRFDPGSAISDTGALVIYSGEKTGRSPADKRIVEHPDSADDIWWGKVNLPLAEHTFQISRQRAVDYFNICSRLYVTDGFVGWDPAYRLKVRIICTRPYHGLFMHNMLIRPTPEQLEAFGEPDYVVMNAGRFPANRYTSHLTSTTSIYLSFERREMIILGTEYAGEMKKGVFTLMHYLMPKQSVLSMHCSANEGKDGNVSLFFGLSGTGKTTLSADPKRSLIGDDEHCWTRKGVFNIEGGCYAKAIDLSDDSEPEIFRAIRFGTILENVTYDKKTRLVDYSDDSITQNTRASYPLEYIENAKTPAIAGHPNHVIFLTCDAFGVLPPVSRLTPEQAMYHFISGYTAKVAGTEMGITEPVVTFSACFGAAFLVWHPSVYAELLAKKLKKYNTRAWLVNTGWIRGSYGSGTRISLPHTRAIIDAIHDGSLNDAIMVEDEVFGLHVPTSCPRVPEDIMIPRDAWADPSAYDEAARRLARLFDRNFEQFRDQSSPAIIEAGPNIS